VRTLTSAVNLDAELARTRARGYAVEEGENEEGAACIGAPIFDESGAVTAGLSVAGPSARLDADRKKEIAPILINSAHRISVTLGFRTAR
jgi:IclR family acetate operon transcriptional repressor